MLYITCIFLIDNTLFNNNSYVNILCCITGVNLATFNFTQTKPETFIIIVTNNFKLFVRIFF